MANITPVNQNAKQQPRYTFSNPQLALIIAEIEQAMQWHAIPKPPQNAGFSGNLKRFRQGGCLQA